MTSEAPRPRAAFSHLAVRHRPALVVAAADVADVADVAAAVRFAASRDLPAAVQATGHGSAQAADGTLLVTTSRLRDLHVAPSARTARIRAGCT